MGEEKESWCKETDVNGSSIKKTKNKQERHVFFSPHFLLLFKCHFNLSQKKLPPNFLTHRHSLMHTHRQTSWKTPIIPSCGISEERPKKSSARNLWVIPSFLHVFSP